MRGGRAVRRERPPKIGMWGLLGSGNMGNDGSLESMLGYLRRAYPDATIDAMTTGPEGLRAQYGLDAVPMLWCQRFEAAPRPVAVLTKVLGKAVDVFRIAAWTRRHDVVIISGAGPLEDSLPLHAWGLPYALLVLAASGRVFGTKLAFVSVGASRVKKRATRRLGTVAARLAFYRSFRDDFARQAMEWRGLDTTGDPLYPDLVYGLPLPAYVAADPMTVGVGVMAFYGGNDDRRDADEINAQYRDSMKKFVRWLVDTGHRVRLFTGDVVDNAVVAEILADIRDQRPGVPADQVTAPAAPTLGELLLAMAPVGTVVGIRYHNLIAAAKLGKPAISVSYSPKHDVLMDDLGLGEFCVPARWLDADLLIDRFSQLEARSAELRLILADRVNGKTERLAEQFALLSEVLLPGFPAAVPAVAADSARSLAG
jgi:polysaccharide pyruvyl transferase WcaK-like protein